MLALRLYGKMNFYWTWTLDMLQLALGLPLKGGYFLRDVRYRLLSVVSKKVNFILCEQSKSQTESLL